ncbi:MAG: Long-chain-fatty-acid--CoA ligase FadD13 [Candidatus Heimdallarchaeota archaeon LC_3]|nr:MAG: Long-chain-fatty-acid--CoA ligase FadD13 [Candidatus Heimdallarchaeota archaeon LC_3]
MENSWTWVGNWAEKRAELSPERVALIDDITGMKYTYNELNKRSDKLCNVLREKKISKGDRITVFSKNRIELIDLFLATSKIGVILVPLNFRLANPEVEYQINKTTPKLLIYDTSLNNQVLEIKKEISVKNFIAMGDNPINNDRQLNSFITEADDKFENNQDLSLDDPHLILFTGGTTGLPKGAVLSHRLIFWNSVNTITSWGIRPDDIQPLMFPLFHTGGWNVLFVPFYHMGGTNILMGDFNPERTLEVIEKFKCSLVIGVPTVFQMIAESEMFSKANLSSVRVFISGGAPCPLSIMEKYWKRQKEFKMGYGLTEVGPNNFYLPEKDIKRKPLSVGFPVFHCDMKLVDDENNTVSQGSIGELCLRGPHIFSGYWDDLDETNKTIDSNGWVHTGDLAKKDEEGFYYIVDRKKDMYISGGENIFPVEVEEVIYKHPDILEVAVFGIPNEKWGEVGVAAIATKSGNKISDDELKQLLEDKLARYKHPKYFQYYKELPKSAAGKILRREVKKSFKNSE